MMSKRDYARTTLILGGCDFATTLSGLELMSDVKEAMKPNKVTVCALPARKEMTPADKDIVQSLFVSVDLYMSLFKVR